MEAFTFGLGVGTYFADEIDVVWMSVKPTTFFSRFLMTVRFELLLVIDLIV